MAETTKTHAVAVERFEAAKDERNRTSDRYETAKGSRGELPASVELSAADEQLAAREAWLKWVERDY